MTHTPWYSAPRLISRLIRYGPICLLLCMAHASLALACWQEAAEQHQVNPYLLSAIAKTESGYNPQAVHHNRNGTRDIGLMQINSLWLPELARHGIREADLYDPCTNLHVGAWLLRRQQLQHGNTWDAVGRYHSATPHLKTRYAQRVKYHMQQLLEKATP